MEVERRWLRKHGLADWANQQQSSASSLLPRGTLEPDAEALEFLHTECGRTGVQSLAAATAAFAWLPVAVRSLDAPPSGLESEQQAVTHTHKRALWENAAEAKTSDDLLRRMAEIEAALTAQMAKPAKRAAGVLERRASAAPILLQDRPKELAEGEKPPKPMTDKDFKAALTRQHELLEVERKSLRYKIAVALALDAIATQLRKWEETQEACGGGLDPATHEQLQADILAARRKHGKAAVEAKRHEVRQQVAASDAKEERKAREDLLDLKQQYEDVAAFRTFKPKRFGFDMSWEDCELICEHETCTLTAHFGNETDKEINVAGGKRRTDIGGVRRRCADHKEEGDLHHPRALRSYLPRASGRHARRKKLPPPLPPVRNIHRILKPNLHHVLDASEGSLLRGEGSSGGCILASAIGSIHHF